jgi:glyoxylase-like metal-dependent hydrolase (beta-lactamase superfamily II)
MALILSVPGVLDWVTLSKSYQNLQAEIIMAEIRLDVKTSAIWQMTSTVITAGRSCLVVDPGYFPAELDEIVRMIPRGATVEALVFSHSHWDHVIGHEWFPGVPVYVSSVLAGSVAEGGDLATRAMTEAWQFDSQWYVLRRGSYTWPSDLRGLDDGGWFNIGDLELEVFSIPGHAPDCLALRAENWLLAGDYLSPCEIPFIDNFGDYRRSLGRLLTFIGTGIEHVVPGHGPVLSAEEARSIAREDLRYLDAVARCAADGDAEAARKIALPRAGGVYGMADHHLDNCRKAGLEIL